ncbi:MAG TPA: fumarylacetoacetate hydrolase family protein [Alphaproteobacteria bacterium]|nr:fumarylacetoacetate hydrolase family protein [Alphaproteobacteria bacterium]
MKLARCARNGDIYWAVVDTAAGTLHPIAGTPADWGPALTDGGSEEALTFTGSSHALTEATLLPPIEPTSQVFVVGANYLKHLQELKMEPPKSPIAFLKSNRALIGAKDDIWHSPLTNQLDYEVELVAVIGKPLAGGDVTRSVLGYTVGNDISARDLQRSGIGFDLFSSKSLDHTTGLGPWIVTRDAFGDGTPDIRMKTVVNGETRQDARTGEMTWKLDVILPYVDTRAALQTGDVVFTGTPEGVAWASGRFLKPGDTVEVSLEGIGALTNKVVAR